MTSLHTYAEIRKGAVQSAPAGTSAVARWQWVQNEIFDHEDLSTSEICVAVVLASHVNDRTQDCFPRIETIACEAGLSERKVRQALKRLEQLGLIRRLVRCAGRLRNRNAYQLVGLGAKAASGSLKPAPDSGVKPACGAGSNMNTDKEGNTDEKEQAHAHATSGTGAVILPSVDDQCLILTREWQRLCADPWTLANACLRVNEAIDRVGFDAVQQALEEVKRRGKRPSRLGVLDILDGLVAKCFEEEKADAVPDLCDPSDPSEWHDICQVVAQADIPGCRNPRLWLSQIRAVVNGNTIDLKARNRCVQDITRHHLMPVIEAVAGSRGLLIGDVSCVS
ncbi:phage replication initiation protein [Thalassospira xiamenensis M-5 = DSM 17429]|uniref:Phage replication initiation protein n=1 Tax=Thalassospira xiamenensis M-5 = DSM 17429 TaxID=1123366 RepID=A0AB72UEY2_9PROT|nr:helix-turn-helix domain-containing protein [Thalassospira xiamenensis]AJD52770.1 phage replication initiation protein [Thalassospira xiamenensis M-5 = DSM 17429]